MNEQLLDKIHKRLYNVESSVESATEEFQKQNISVSKFLQIITLYISSFPKLKNFNNETLLILLEEKLRDIENHYEDVNLYAPKIKSSITFIEKHVNEFFPTNKQSGYLDKKHLSIPIKRNISTLNEIGSVMILLI